MQERRNDDMTEKLIVEAMITIVTQMPALIQMFQRQGKITPEEAHRHRQRIRMALSILEKSWDDYIKEAQELYGDRQG